MVVAVVRVGVGWLCWPCWMASSAAVCGVTPSGFVAAVCGLMGALE